VSYDDAVSEALAVGWIDSLGGKFDADRTVLYFTRRKPGSAWSRPNSVEETAALAARGEPANQWRPRPGDPPVG